MIPVSDKEITVSIVCAVYNRKKLFMRAYESVMNQSFQNFELIVVDDGSDDGLHKILPDISKNDYRIKYLRHSNRGTPLSLNAGIRLSSGKYITFIDSDDEYGKEHIKKRVMHMNRNRDIDIIHSKAVLIGKDEDMYVPDARRKGKLIHLNECVLGATIFARRNVFEELNGFRKVFSYDSDFIRRAEKKCNVKMVDYMTYFYYRDTGDSVLSEMKRKYF